MVLSRGATPALKRVDEAMRVVFDRDSVHLKLLPVPAGLLNTILTGVEEGSIIVVGGLIC